MFSAVVRWAPSLAASPVGARGALGAAAPATAAAALGAAASQARLLSGGYNEEPEERESVADESAAALQRDRRNAEKLAAEQGAGLAALSERQAAQALAGESREAAAEHAEDAQDVSQLQDQDTLTDKHTLEGKAEGHSFST